MKKLKPWARLPSQWIEDRGLRTFRWGKDTGANNVAALMALAAICHRADDDGVAKMTYDDLCGATALSRAKLSAGLQILTDRAVIGRGIDGRSSFQLCNYSLASGWAKFPAEGLYRGETVSAFAAMHLRSRAELDALKLYYLFVSRRDRFKNAAIISYEKIEEYSGVPRNNIRTALTLLAVQGLVRVDRLASGVNEHGFASSYRLTHLDNRTHAGTAGRIPN